MEAPNSEAPALISDPHISGSFLVKQALRSLRHHFIDYDSTLTNASLYCFVARRSGMQAHRDNRSKIYIPCDIQCDLFPVGHTVHHCEPSDTKSTLVYCVVVVHVAAPSMFDPLPLTVRVPPPALIALTVMRFPCAFAAVGSVTVILPLTRITLSVSTAWYAAVTVTTGAFSR